MSEFAHHLMTMASIFGVGGTILTGQESWGIPFLVVGAAFIVVSMYKTQNANNE